jgi:oligopeptidase B
MNRREALLAGASLVGWGALGPFAEASGACAAAPRTPIRPQRIVQLGRTRVDDYAWLKPENWKAVWRDPGVLPADIAAHLAAENAYCAAMLAPDAPLAATLLEEMKARTPPLQGEPPQPDGLFEYFSRFEPGAQHPVFLRRRGGGGPEEVLLDVEARARASSGASGGFFSVSPPIHSPDHRLLAWAEDSVGSENFTLCVKDLATGVVLPGPARQAYGDFVFSADSQWLYWTWRSPESRPARVYRRPARGEDDVLIYEEADPAFLMQVTRTPSGAYVVIRIWNADTSEVRLISSAAPTETPRLVEPRRPGLLYAVDHWNDRLVVLTNADGAVDFKLMWADLSDPSRRGWRPWLAHRPGRFIIGMRAFRNHFVRVERVDARPVLIVAERGSLAERTLDFDEAAYAVEMNAGEAYDTSSLRIIYQSPRTPRRWIAYEMGSDRTRSPRTEAEEAIPGYRPENYVVERLFARSSEEADVPITVLRRNDTPLDGRAPLLLYGYGAYGFSVEADFSVPRLSLVDRGWIYAIAHVRGGSEKGWSWYLAARREQKPRSFEDFIACAEHLSRLGYGRGGRIVAHGLSAGGLLVGASLNLRPELWAGVCAQVPFVDVLNTMSDASHPLVPLARADWGDPLADPCAYDAIAGYSPYDNVAARRYPAVLATGSVADDRVGFWEPAKWAARLRASTRARAPILFKVDMSAGHHGAAGRFEALAEQAQIAAFAMRSVRGGWPCYFAGVR